MILALALLLAAPEPFRAAQWAQTTSVLRGCSECAGEADDVCEVRAGVQLAPLEEVARRPVPGRVRLVRSKADPDCAVPAKAFARAPVEQAAVQLAANAPAVLDPGEIRAATQGWPAAPQRRKLARTAAPDRARLRSALVCWPAAKGWPEGGLSGSNACERWLLAVHPETGEPDVAGASFLVGAAAPYEAHRSDDPPRREAHAETAPEVLRPAAAARVAASPEPCSDAARARTATLDRFDQWDAQLRGAPRSSLDRATLSLDAQAWTGHCQELEVLRAALEQQLGCVVPERGACPREGR